MGSKPSSPSNQRFARGAECRAAEGRPSLLSTPAIHVDHCHETGKVRGVLCFNCNSAIGKLGDDPDTVRRAAAYLEGSSWKPTLVAQGVYRLPS
ncbi:endonuclease VII domain-containing protein [Streptomyces sp. NPDC048518]|uniref:endonuclease VII domain-containing protein n=1 Tax=Streptomyces sp. NPDC048518 TaxID=3155029 RepID=UPI0033EF0F9E